MHTLLAIVSLSIALVVPSDSLPGRYVLNRDASENVAAVVDAAVRSVNRLKRSRMRSELLTQLQPSPTLKIREDASGFVITDDAGRVLRAVPGAPTSRITTPRGEVATVDALTRSDTLVVRIQSPSARREQRFIASATELIVLSTYTLDALDTPIRLRIAYRREAR